MKILAYLWIASFVPCVAYASIAESDSTIYKALKVERHEVKDDSAKVPGVRVYEKSVGGLSCRVRVLEGSNDESSASCTLSKDHDAQAIWNALDPALADDRGGAKTDQGEIFTDVRYGRLSCTMVEKQKTYVRDRVKPAKDDKNHGEDASSPITIKYARYVCRLPVREATPKDKKKVDPKVKKEGSDYHSDQESISNQKQKMIIVPPSTNDNGGKDSAPTKESGKPSENL